MKSKYDKNDKKESSEKDKTKTKNMNDSKLDDKTLGNEHKSGSFWTKSVTNQNGLLCPKSVRNHLKKSESTKDKHSDCISSDKEIKDGSKSSKDQHIMKYIKKAITEVSDNQMVSISKINKETVDLPISLIKQTSTKPSLIYNCNPLTVVQKVSSDDSKHVTKGKKKKKHIKSKVHDASDNECKDSLRKMKKNRKSKKKKNKDSDATNLPSDKEVKKEIYEKDYATETKSVELPKSFLVSYSSDEDDANVEAVLIKKSPEIKLELKVSSTESTNKSENKIEIKLKPTKSPGKSTWESSESDIEAESKKLSIEQLKSPNIISVSTPPKKSKSLSKSVKSKSHSLSESHSTSRSLSHNSSHSSSRSESYTDYSCRSSRSYSRSRSYSKSKRHSKRKRRYSSSSSSYSRSRSRYHSRSSSRSSSYSRSSRSYTRSRSRYKSSYSSRYRSRSRSHSSRSRSNSYYRSSYRKRKRSSSTNRFLNVPTRKVKAAPIRNSVLQGGPQRHVDIGKKIDAIKESQRKALNNDNLSNLNIPLPPEKPKGNLFKTGEAYASIDLSGPVAKKSKKNMPGSKVNTDLKSVDRLDNNQLPYPQSIDNYIGPQVSSDMAKKLGLDVKSINMKKEKMKDNYKTEPITSDSFMAPTLDAAHIALQSRAYQHRLYNLQGSTSQDVAAQGAQYYHPLYMSASSLSNNLTAIASAAVANEQLPASVAGSLAQAAVQRIMSSSNLTATYNTPSVMASPNAANLQTAFQHSIPSSCGTLMANTPSGLIPISLLQQGGFQVGLNPLLLQQLQQQALNAQFGQAMSLPNQLNQLLLQASNQQALLQSLGVNVQAQLLGSPLNFQHTLLMAAQQQQQQQQLFAAAQINQAALQAAHLQAQIQAQARAVSIQNLQQAAQMQSSAQNAASASIANVATLSDMGEGTQKQDNADHISVTTEKSDLEETYIYSDQHDMSYNPNNSLTVPADNIIGICNDQIISAHEVELEPGQSAPDYDNIGHYNSTTKQQAPRIIYNSAAVMESIDISSPVSKS